MCCAGADELQTRMRGTSAIRKTRSWMCESTYLMDGAGYAESTTSTMIDRRLTSPRSRDSPNTTVQSSRSTASATAAVYAIAARIRLTSGGCYSLAFIAHLDCCNDLFAWRIILYSIILMQIIFITYNVHELIIAIILKELQ